MVAVLQVHRSAALAPIKLLLAALAVVHWSRNALCAPPAGTGLEQLARNASQLSRLRQMFHESQLEAVRGHQEYQMLKRLSEDTNHSQITEPRESFTLIPLSVDGPPAGFGSAPDVPQTLARSRVVSYQSEPSISGLKSTSDIDSKNNNTKPTTRNDEPPPANDDGNGDNDDDASLASLIHPDAKELKNDARQSSLFPGLVSPSYGNSFGLGGGNTNPLMNGALLRPPAGLPSLPSLQSFRLPGFLPQQQQQQQFQLLPPRPPKSSVIGNGGGAMALTNDNVVVVNVLSGNY